MVNSRSGNSYCFTIFTIKVALDSFEVLFYSFIFSMELDSANNLMTLVFTLNLSICHNGLFPCSHCDHDLASIQYGDVFTVIL